MDDDSEAEKLSPLLQKIDDRSNNLALHMADVIDSIDDTDTDHDDSTSVQVPIKIKKNKARDDESDYYTPDELVPSTAPLYEITMSSMGSTSQRLPHSHATARSNGDSCTNGSSTRNLLTVITSTNSGSSERSVDV